MPARVAAGLIIFAAGWCIPGAIRTAQGGLGVEWWRPGGYTFGRISAIYSPEGRAVEEIGRRVWPPAWNRPILSAALEGVPGACRI